MPYFKRIAQRRKLNPLAIGLKSRSGDDNPSFFYREILLRGFVNFSNFMRRLFAACFVANVLYLRY